MNLVGQNMKWLHDYWHKIAPPLAVITIASLVTWVLPGGWDTIGSWFGSLFGWLGRDVTIARWSFLLFWICVVTLVGLMLLTGWRHVMVKRDAAQYASDTVFGVKWRWKWTPHGIDQLFPFCPHCDFQIQPVGGRSYLVRGTTYVCDNPECRRFKKDFEESYDEVRDLVIRKIQQELRAHFGDS